MNATNALIQETVRAFYTGWYTELVTDLPRIENGYVYLPDRPRAGHRTAARPRSAPRRYAQELAAMTTTLDVEVVLDAHAAVGEGPVWDQRSNRLFWVDIMGHKVHVYDPATSRLVG